ncbi:hypothetical protein [Thermococcus sp. 21S7]|uniref:hypothetical protein n=1 Tax=Thermococcus sp. 21S7 TaxID=1638221 RepID=UPI00143B8C0B|nr:hypothetical protein [Thermococcus sp. 21S7]NJE61982.1 hypothetical protein [Thermococcus sp. 21S7]
MSKMERSGVMLGVDIGSSHIKTTTLCLSSKNIDFNVYPISYITGKLKLSGTMKGRIEKLIIPALDATLSKYSKKYDTVYVNLVTSLEAAAPWYDYLSKFKEIEMKYENVILHTMTGSLSVEQLTSLKSWQYMSSIHAVRYIAEKLLENGMLIHMNSASTLFIPVLSGRAIPMEIHYSSGVALWVGALYTPLPSVSNNVLVFGKKSLSSPTTNIKLYEALSLIAKTEVARTLKEYKSPYRVDSINSSEVILQFIGCFPNKKYLNKITNTPYNLHNQAKISAFYIYSTYLNKILENVLMVLSEVDIPIDTAKFLVSGIGKDPILKDALYIFADKLMDIEIYIPKPYCIFLESFGAALSLYEYLTSEKISLTAGQFWQTFNGG